MTTDTGVIPLLCACGRPIKPCPDSLAEVTRAFDGLCAGYTHQDDTHFCRPGSDDLAYPKKVTAR